MVERNHSEADLALFLKSYILVARSYSPTGNDIHQMVPLSSLTINFPVKFIRRKFELFLGQIMYFMKRRSALQLFVSVIGTLSIEDEM